MKISGIYGLGVGEFESNYPFFLKNYCFWITGFDFRHQHDLSNFLFKRMEFGIHAEQPENQATEALCVTIFYSYKMFAWDNEDVQACNRK